MNKDQGTFSADHGTLQQENKAKIKELKESSTSLSNEVSELQVTLKKQESLITS